MSTIKERYNRLNYPLHTFTLQNIPDIYTRILEAISNSSIECSIRGGFAVCLHLKENRREMADIDFFAKPTYKQDFIQLLYLIDPTVTIYEEAISVERERLTAFFEGENDYCKIEVIFHNQNISKEYIKLENLLIPVISFQQVLSEKLYKLTELNNNLTYGRKAKKHTQDFLRMISFCNDEVKQNVSLEKTSIMKIEENIAPYINNEIKTIVSEFLREVANDDYIQGRI